VLPGGSYTVTIRGDYPNKPGMLGRVASVIGEAGGDISSIDLVEADRTRMVRDITVGMQNAEHARAVIDALRKRIPGFQVRSASDRVFLAHLGGKIAIQNRVPVKTRRDLSQVYTPGVARVSSAIATDPEVAWQLTGKGNTVAIVTNGTAVLGLGDIGPTAALPVMEGKAMLFKEFADVDAWPVCLDTKDPDEIVRIVKAMSPGFGGINLEDIAAPACFQIEQRLREELDIPVFHDDQHGTAIIVAAAVYNAMHLTGKSMDKLKLVTSGAGAAAIACLNQLVQLGVKRENIWVTDIEGVVYKGRQKLMDQWKGVYAQDTDKRTLADVIEGADVFLGLSAPGVLKPDMAKRMGSQPLIMALANPTPEISPEEALAVRPDAMICTGRSDYPNQVNNVLCFPFIFRGALDVGATTINEEMKLAAIRAIAALAREAPSDVVARAAGGEVRNFGGGSLIPNPFDPRLILRIAPAVARAAMDSGVATRPIADFAQYAERLNGFVFRSGFIMKPVFTQAKTAPKRVVYAEGEDERVLRAAQVAIEEGLAKPILVGRPSVVEARLARFGLSIKPGKEFELVNPEDDPRYRAYVQDYIGIAGRKGITPEAARTLVRTNATVIASIMLHRGEADAMICGVEGRFLSHLRHIRAVIGYAPGITEFAAMSLIITARGAFFVSDTEVRAEPTATEIAEMAVLAAQHVRRFGLEPKIALVSHSDFGSHDTKSARKMRAANAILAQEHPELEVDGEMHGDSALDEALREKVFPHSRLKGQANVLIMPNLDAANIASKLIADALPVGPILMGAARPAHILTPTVTARGVVNMTAVAVVEAQGSAASL
jgi:malate dehydrogenase (oxaloacetate-decarboxylating)(NADP+)